MVVELTEQELSIALLSEPQLNIFIYLQSKIKPDKN